MTAATLTATLSPSVEQVIPYYPKDDSSEAAQWEQLSNPGEVSDDEYSDDLSELGITGPDRRF